MPSAIESISPEVVGRILSDAKLIESMAGLRVEPMARNPERRDYHTRGGFRVFSGDRAVCYLIAGQGLEDVRQRAQAFAEACPSIACRPVLWHREGEWDFLGLELFSGANLNILVLGGRLTLQEAVRCAGRIAVTLEGTRQVSSREEASRELEALFARICASAMFSGLDQIFLREVVFPLIRAGALAGPFFTQWTNRDLVSHNVLLDGQGNLRLTDYEFAERTHFFAEDWWRWQRHSGLPLQARDVPALRGGVPDAPWLEALFLLRQLVLVHDTNGAYIALEDAHPAASRLLALVSEAHWNFRSSAFFKAVARASAAFASRDLLTAQLSWDVQDHFCDEQSQRLTYAPDSDIALRFTIPAIRGPFSLRFSPVDAPGVLRISGLRVSSAPGGSTLFALAAPTGWERVSLGDGLMRLKDSATVNLLSQHREPHLFLPRLRAGLFPCDLSCEVWLRFTRNLTSLPDSLPPPAELASAPEGTPVPRKSGEAF